MDNWKQDLRDRLEVELVESAKQGDTTVLAELLGRLSDEEIYAALSDEGQSETKPIPVMYDFSNLTDNEKDTIVSVLNGQWNLLGDKLQETNLGDIERMRTEEYKVDVRKIMEKVGVQFP